MTRPRFPSRPDPRADDATPPSGTPARPSTPLDIVRDELRDLRCRMGTTETRVDELEDWTESSKVRTQADDSARSKWGDRVWQLVQAVVAAVLIAGILTGISYLRCVPPPPQSTKVEAKP